MKSLWNKIKIGIVGVIALVLFSGCSSEGDSKKIYGCTDPIATNYNPKATEDDGSCEPPVKKTIPVIGDITLPSEVNEKTPFTWEVDATNEDGNPIYLYKTGANSDWLTLNSTPGVENSATAPDVSTDTNYNIKILACNEDVTQDSSDKCSSENVSIKVNDVAKNSFPVIQGIVLSNNASADSNNIYQTWGQDIEGEIIATDTTGDIITYSMDVSGDAYLNWIDGNEFSIAIPQQTSSDATADLGQATIKACDDQGCDTKNLGIVGKNPVQANLWRDYDWYGNYVDYDVVSEVTNVGNPMLDIDFYINDEIVYQDTNWDSSLYDFAIGTFSTTYGENPSFQVEWRNNSGDVRKVSLEGIYVPTEAEWRQDVKAILDANSDKYNRYIEDGIVYGDGGNVNYDFKIVKLDGSWAFINYAGESDNLTEILEDEELLEIWGNSHSYHYKNDRGTIKSIVTDYVVGGF
jgi:hypothetical protein